MRKLGLILLMAVCGFGTVLDDYTSPVTYSANSVLNASALNEPQDTLENLIAKNNATIEADFIRFTDVDSTITINTLIVTDSLSADTAVINDLTAATADINAGTFDGTIGGSTPAAGTFTTLNATGGGALTGTWSDLGDVTTVNIDGGTVDGVIVGGSSAAAADFTTVNTTGDVGIGVATSTQMLHVESATSTQVLLKNTGSSSVIITSDANRTSADQSLLNLVTDWDGTSVTSIGFISGTDNVNKDDGLMVFRTAEGGVLSEQMRIDQDGDVGIGTGTPGAKLHVKQTSEQLRLGYDGSNITTFTVSSGGDLTVAPSGGDMDITGTLDVSSSLTSTTLNTGQGANELHAMDQDVETTNAVTFGSVNTGQGANELYAMDQEVLTTSDVHFEETRVEAILYTDVVEYTISSGIVDIAGHANVRILNEGGAANDDLDGFTSAPVGGILIVRQGSASQDIAFKDGSALRMAGDFSMTNNVSVILFFCSSSTVCFEISRSDN